MIQKIGTVPYKLKLPQNARIHNALHVSQLKKYEGDDNLEYSFLPFMDSDGQVKIEPKKLCKNGSLPARVMLS